MESKERIHALLKKGVYIGTSSWKYEGWKDLIYRRQYRNVKDFNENCLTEYAEHYSAVGVDHTFYTWPTERGFQKYVDQTPDWFRFGLKVTERITIWQYPKMSRYGKEAGTKNATFLDAKLFNEQFMAPLEPFKKRLGPVMLEFSHFYPGTLASGQEFTDRLDKFFEDAGIRHSGVQFAVEIRNPNWLKNPYFDMLRRHGVAHVFNSWTRMPSLGDQLRVTDDYHMPCYVSRVLLRPGTKYEQAVEAFSPYDKVCDLQPGLRTDAASIVRRAIDLGVQAYVFVNNRAEGCAPKTIDGILEYLN
jgi:uncharacterized protein YecE (DUF72 family)